MIAVMTMNDKVPKRKERGKGVPYAGDKGSFIPSASHWGEEQLELFHAQYVHTDTTELSILIPQTYFNLESPYDESMPTSFSSAKP